MANVFYCCLNADCGVGLQVNGMVESIIQFKEGTGDIAERFPMVGEFPFTPRVNCLGELQLIAANSPVVRMANIRPGASTPRPASVPKMPAVAKAVDMNAAPVTPPKNPFV